MSNKVDFMADVEDHPLSLPYFKLHREVLEKFVKHDMSATAQRVYLYLCHNCQVHQGRTFRLDMAQIAAFLDCDVRTVYRAFEQIEDAGLATIREHGKVVLDMPFIVKAQIEAKTLAVSSNVKEREAKVEGKIEEMVQATEQTLGRTLSMRERENFTRLMLPKLLGTGD